ncbi:plasmid partitioning protein RepB [Cognatishimia sp. MH4019]|uniref:plasmid partitioning protein RepB n=1 Tax=Cognatishimia sp. MH4019 TaxID=2854030 RepID=UPI001CD808E0|nr:plasmid partitioning protein RepB [Cognatishimia sp. MH4019]
MARKNLLQGLMDDAKSKDTPAEPRVDVARPRYTTGAIGAVSESIAKLKSRSVVDLDPFTVEGAGVKDRLDYDDPEHEELVASIRDYGQQVPILVRPHPEEPERFQIVYGRRRLLALRDLKMPAKALVRDLDDAALVLAQGQENSARKDLSFIEKCNFAKQMRDAGYDRKAICGALSSDKTSVSRMLKVIDDIPIELIEVIGPAAGVGRDRWAGLAAKLSKDDFSTNDIVGTVNLLAGTLSSDERFEAALSAIGEGRAGSKAPDPSDLAKTRTQTNVVRSENGFEIAKVKRSDEAVTVVVPGTEEGKFGDWLAQNIEEIYREWVTQTSGGK